MLNQTTEHALRALLYLARGPEGRAISAERIAHALGAPQNYLGKTLNALARAGIVASTRGPAGGFRLRRPADAITLEEVVECFRDVRPGAICLLGDRACNERRPCAAHRRWTAVWDEMRAPLKRTTLADLAQAEATEPAGGGAGTPDPAAQAA